MANIEATPGSSDLLTRLAPKMTVGVVTNGGSVTQRAKLDRAGLAAYAPTVIISEEIGAAKRRPRDLLLVGLDTRRYGVAQRLWREGRTPNGSRRGSAMSPRRSTRAASGE